VGHSGIRYIFFGLTLFFLCRYADDTSGLTWGGQSYETNDAQPDGSVSTETTLVGAGVDIRDTEAVLVTFVRKHNKRFHSRK
jgi:hypothetical protein